MMFNVPQFIDVEDKIVGPLTAKQLGWLALGGVAGLVFWSLLDFSAFIMAALVVGIIVGLLAFYRPNNQSLLKFLISAVAFVFKPKMYIWKRVPENVKKAAPVKKKVQEMPKKSINEGKIEEISNLLDNRKSIL